jgi:hypothetical protein
MKKSFIEKITSKSFRRTAKEFLIWVIILSLFVLIFVKSVYYVKDNLHTIKKPFIKEEQVGAVDTERLKIEETDNVSVGDIAIS